MLIYKAKVYDLDECIIASGYPMLSKYELREVYTDQDLQRAIKLAQTPSASGHGNFLKGICVNLDILATGGWWTQANRYDHFVIVSSMSVMHRGKFMDLDVQCPDLPEDLMTVLKKYQQQHKDGEISIEEFSRMLPRGLMYGARVSTNYMQLKTMYNQRKTHKLGEWRKFCDWIEALPFAEKFITSTSKG